MFLMGGAVLVSLLSPGLSAENIEIIPGFFTIIGIIIVSATTSWFGILASAFAVSFFVGDEEDIGQLIMIPLGSVFGFIPIFIYGAWIGLQVKG